MVPHKQIKDEMGRKIVANNPIWPVHHIRYDWRQCIFSQFSSIHADVLNGEN